MLLLVDVVMSHSCCTDIHILDCVHMSWQNTFKMLHIIKFNGLCIYNVQCAKSVTLMYMLVDLW